MLTPAQREKALRQLTSARYRLAQSARMTALWADPAWRREVLRKRRAANAARKAGGG